MQNTGDDALLRQPAGARGITSMPPDMGNGANRPKIADGELVRPIYVPTPRFRVKTACEPTPVHSASTVSFSAEGRSSIPPAT